MILTLIDYFYLKSNQNEGGGENNDVPAPQGGNGEFQDETLPCKDCGSDFIFTAGEQEFYAQKQFQNKPVRCRTCKVEKVQLIHRCYFL